MEAALARLKKDFGYKSLEEAEKEADKAERLVAKLEAACQVAQGKATAA